MESIVLLRCEGGAGSNSIGYVLNSIDNPPPTFALNIRAFRHTGSR